MQVANRECRFVLHNCFSFAQFSAATPKLKAGITENATQAINLGSFISKRQNNINIVL
jgi:hypothetical protein